MDRKTRWIKEENMNKFITIIVALMLTGTVALADNNMITSKINDVSNNVKTFVINEKDKTISYQKKSWEEARLQLAGLFQSLSNLFNRN
jgi:hypothetical protein